jgi:hypothetical protein
MNSLQFQQFIQKKKERKNKMAKDGHPIEVRKIDGMRFIQNSEDLFEGGRFAKYHDIEEARRVWGCYHEEISQMKLLAEAGDIIRECHSSSELDSRLNELLENSSSCFPSPGYVEGPATGTCALRNNPSFENAVRILEEMN